MCADVSHVTNDINYRKFIRNKHRKRIFIFSQNEPLDKVKSNIKMNNVMNNEFVLSNVLKLDLKPQAVVTLSQFQATEKNDSYNKTNELTISTDDRKALSENSLKFCRNLLHKYTCYKNANFKANYKVYRCQISTNQETCCCSCNSDAMFEVMKSLYDCYKKKNCDNCNCFLCGRSQREERGQQEKQKIEIQTIEKVDGKVTQKKEKPLQEKAGLEIVKTISETKDRIGVEKASAPKEASVSTEILKDKTPDLLRLLETTPPNQKEKIIKEAVLKGAPIPEAKTTTEKKIIDKIQNDVGLPPKPKSSSKKAKYENALHKGLITPLEGKTALQKEKILRGQANLGLELPKGRTSSEKALIAKVQTEAKATKKNKLLEKKTAKSLKESQGPSDECICSVMTQIVDSLDEKMIKKETELSSLSLLKGKTKSQKEKVLKGMVFQGTALPDGKTSSEKELLDNVRRSLGLPPAPKSKALRQKYKEATAARIITPLEGKTSKQKEKILREQAALGIPLPEGRTASEKSIVAKVKAVAPPLSDIPVSSRILKKVKDTGLLTPIKGKSREEKEKILTGLAMHGVPLPEVRTASEKKIIDKIHADLGLPPPPISSAAKEKYQKAYAEGLIVPLEGKTASQKEKVLQNQADMGLDLPIGRTSSEKVLIEKLKGKTKEFAPIRRLKGKSPQQKEVILKGLAMNGILLPEAKSLSVKKIIEKVQNDLGLPPEPTKESEKRAYKQSIATGDIAPLEGKSPTQKEKILQNVAKLGLELPTGRTPSEKELVAKYRKAMITGQIGPLEGKTRSQKDYIDKDQTKTSSEKSLIDRVKKTRTSSVGKVVSDVHVPSHVIKKAKDAGLLTPLVGKKKKQKEVILKGLALHNIPLPEAKTASENKIIAKVREDLGLPPAPKSTTEKDKYNRAIITRKIEPLEGKTRSQKEEILKKQIIMGFDLPQGRTSSEKSLIDKVKKSRTPSALGKVTSEVRVPSHLMKKAKDAGLLTPLAGKKNKQKEAILKGLALHNIPLPEAKTASENKLIAKVREDIGLPPAPKSTTEKNKYNKAIITRQIAPLEGKTRSQKEEILKNQIMIGLNLPKGRTSSEKSLIAKIKKQPVATGKIKKLSEVTIPTQVPKGDVSKKSIVDRATLEIPSEVIKKAKAAGLLTPLKGKKKKEKENILKSLAMNGFPLPEAKTSSEEKLIEKIRTDIGLPAEPVSSAEKVKYKKAIITGKIGPLEGKTPSQKEDIIRNQLKMGLVLPKGRTSSEKKLIDKVKIESEVRLSSKQWKKAKADGLLTPLEGKSKEQKESIIKGLAMNNIPLPDAKSPSENKILEKVRADIGLPPAPETPANKDKYNKAVISGHIAPLEGKTASQKEEILRKEAALGIQLPKGRTSSEKALIAKIKTLTPKTSKEGQKMEKLSAKTMKESKGPVDACICDIVSPVIEKSSENILKPKSIMSQQIIKAEAAGYFKPLEGKPKHEKEKILKDLAIQGIALPKAKNKSEKNMLEKVRLDLGLPSEPRSVEEKQIYDRALTKGLLVPLEGKSKSQKEKILRNQAALGIHLPKGRTPSEISMIEMVKKTTKKSSKTSMSKTPKEREKVEKLSDKTMKESKGPVDACICDVVSPGIEKSTENILKPKSIMSEQRNKAEAAGYFKQLEGKSKHDKEKILKDLAVKGITLPKAKNKSEKKIIDKVRLDLGLPSEPRSEKEKQRYDKALTKGLLVPLEGKSKSQKEKILRNQAALGINLPKGRTPSEISMIEMVKKTSKKASKISIISGSVKDLVVKQKKDIASKHGISESIQEVTKTTTCEKGCGCDLKKVKFKHSYVKIRITSPDISSICPCPEECFPGVQGGVFTDNEGIKITVGRVLELSGFLHNHQEDIIKKYSMMTFKSFNKLYKKDNKECKTTRSEGCLVKNTNNEFKLGISSVKSNADLNAKIDESDDAASCILKNYSSTTVNSSLSSRIFKIDSSLSFVTPNSNSNTSLNLLHQCNQYFEDDVGDESLNQFRSEIHFERRSSDSLNMLSDTYENYSTTYSEALVQNVSQYLCPMKFTRSDCQQHENYNHACGSSNFIQNVKDNDLEDVLKQMIAKELISQSSSFIIMVPTSSEEMSDYYSPSHMRSSIYIQVSKNCCYRDTPRNKSNTPIKKIEFKFSNDDVSLRPCSTGASKKLTKRDSTLQSCTQQVKKSRVISTDTTQDRPCCCDHVLSQGRRDDYCNAPNMCSPPKPSVDKSTSSDKSYTNTTTLMDMLKKTMSIACGTGEDISKQVKRKYIPKVQQRTGHPCGCCSSIELSHYEISVEMEDSKKKKNAPCSSSSFSSSKSNIICQCSDESGAIDCDKYLKQVQSDLTQCTSGFKLKVTPHASLEDVQRYYAKQMHSNTDCACSKRANKNCECPTPVSVEPFKGLKLHMEGKGSAAKGLNKFLCFDLLDYTSPYQGPRIDSNSMLVSVFSNHEL